MAACSDRSPSSNLFVTGMLLLSCRCSSHVTQVPIPESERAAVADAAAVSKPSKLALGAEGGFALEAQKDYTLDKTASLVVLQGAGQPRPEVPLPCPELPELVINVINAIQVRVGIRMLCTSECRQATTSRSVRVCWGRCIADAL